MEIDASSLRSFVGTIQVKYIFDLSEADDFVKLIIEDLELDFDIGKVGVINFSFVFKYDENPSFTLSWECMKIEVGSTKNLYFYFYSPVGDLTENIDNYVHV